MPGTVLKQLKYSPVIVAVAVAEPLVPVTVLKKQETLVDADGDKFILMKDASVRCAGAFGVVHRFIEMKAMRKWDIL